MVNNVFIRPKGQRYWVVRAESGYYYDVFIDQSIVSISHINELTIDDAKNYKPDIKDLETNMQDVYKREERFKGTFTSHFHQVRNFIYDMQVGDLVLTVGDKELRIGRIKSNPKINNRQVTYYYNDNNKKVLDHKLRRNVAWGPTFKRENLPYAIIRSLRANQAVFNIDDHWEYIHHMLYPVFSYNNKVYFSCNITQKEAINNFAMSQFLLTLSKIEVGVKYLNEDNGYVIDGRTLDEQMGQYLAENRLTLTTKGQYYSPGNIWGTLVFEGGNFLASANDFAAAYLAYLSSNGTDLYDKPALITAISTNIDSFIRAKLQPEPPSQSTEILEDETGDEGPYV